MDTIEEKRINSKSWAISIVLYGAMILALYFFTIQYEPKQELEVFGVDLNYGVDLVGTGDIQTLNKANNSKNNYDVKPEAGPKVESKPQPVVEKKVSEPKKVEPVKQTKVLTATEDTKVTIKNPPVTPKAEPAKVEPKPSPVTEAPKKAAPAPEPVRNVDNGSLMKKSSGSGGSGNSNGTVGNKDGIGGNNNGDGKAGEVGDKGSPNGTPDGKSLYGTPGKGSGTSSGTSVNISGWKNKGSLAISKDQSNETGTIVFDVVINDFGDVINIKNRPTSLSPSVVNYYKSQIQSKLKATLQAEGTPPSKSTGTITIRISRG